MPFARRIAPATIAALALALAVPLTSLTPNRADAAPTPTPTPTPSATPRSTPAPSPASESPTPEATGSAPARPGTPSTEPSASAAPTSDPASPTPSSTPEARRDTVTVAGFEVTGAIRERWNQVGGETGQLGPPTSNAFVAGRGVTVQRFRSGNIYWRSDIGATHLIGDILAKYGEYGYENGFADVPVLGEIRGQDGQSYLNNFLGDTTIIWNRNTGAHLIRGSIRQKWVDLGAERGFGVPSSDEFAGNDNRRSRISFLRRNDGSPATIIWNGNVGAHAVYGSIRDAWHATGAEGGALGAPTSDEFAGRVDTRVQRYERGLIIWSLRTGARNVRGALLDEYARHGWEGGDLGAPISDEWRYDGGFGQDFENGRVLFDGRGFRIQARANPYVRLAGAGDVRFTFRAGCPVGPDQLRVVEMNHLGYDRRVHRGMMVLRADAVDRTVRAFSGAAWDSFPVEKMLNPDVFNGDDPTQMAANNTSGFNCRKVVGNPYSNSPHTYGRAVDINTVQNPYYDGNRWWPDNGRPWIDRNRRDQGMLFNGGLMTRNMTDNGYFWGGWWADRDYQHFQIN